MFFDELALNLSDLRISLERLDCHAGNTEFSDVSDEVHMVHERRELIDSDFFLKNFVTYKTNEKIRCEPLVLVSVYLPVERILKRYNVPDEPTDASVMPLFAQYRSGESRSIALGSLEHVIRQEASSVGLVDDAQSQKIVLVGDDYTDESPVDTNDISTLYSRVLEFFKYDVSFVVCGELVTN